MKIQRFISVAVLTVSAVLSAPTYACSSSIDDGGAFDNGGVLFSHPHQNNSLACGEYAFAGLNQHFGSSFTDYWTFSVAQDTTASISVFDKEVGLDLPLTGVELPGLGHGHSLQGLSHHFDTTKVLDTKYLTFSLFDGSGNLLGTGGENDTLGALSLDAGQWYTLKVSGQVAGLFGSAYYGKLETCVAPVPLGDSAPMLGSALALLGLGYRRRLARKA